MYSRSALEAHGIVAKAVDQALHGERGEQPASPALETVISQIVASLPGTLEERAALLQRLRQMHPSAVWTALWNALRSL